MTSPDTPRPTAPLWPAHARATLLAQRSWLIRCLAGGLALAAVIAIVRWPVHEASFSFTARSLPLFGDPTQRLGGSVGSLLRSTEPEGASLYIRMLTSRAVTTLAVASLRDPAALDNTLDGVLDWALQPDSTRRLHRRARRLAAATEATLDSRTGFVVVTVRLRGRALAAEAADALLATLSRRISERRQQQSRADGDFFGERLTQLDSALGAAERDLSTFIARNRAPASDPQLAAELVRRRRNVDLRQQVYAAAAVSAEQAHGEQIRATPLIVVVDSVAGSTERSFPPLQAAWIGLGLGLLAFAARLIALLSAEPSLDGERR